MLLIRIATQPVIKPAGRTGGNWMIRIQQNGDDVVPFYSGATPEREFPTSLPVGTYQLVGRRMDSNNNLLGDDQTTTYEWTGEGAEMVDVAAGISVVIV
jgi:hypothetical protein